MNSSSKGRSVLNSTCSSLTCKELYGTNSLFRRSIRTTVPSYASLLLVQRLHIGKEMDSRSDRNQLWSTMYKVKIYNGKIIVYIGILTKLNSYQPILTMINCHQMIGLRSSTMKIPTPTEDQQDEIPATRYNLRQPHERRPVDRLMNLQAKRGGM